MVPSLMGATMDDALNTDTFAKTINHLFFQCPFRLDFPIVLSTPPSTNASVIYFYSPTYHDGNNSSYYPYLPSATSSLVTTHHPHSFEDSPPLRILILMVILLTLTLILRAPARKLSAPFRWHSL